MSMREIIENFPKQLAFEPKIVNGDKLLKAKKFVVGGMGGSHLAADLLKRWKPELKVQIHYNYGLPGQIDSHTLFIASSYSGNTEETIDFLEEAIRQKLPAAAVGTGGRLIEIARENNLPHVIFPDDAVQPRFGLGYSFKSLLQLIGDEAGLREAAVLAGILKPSDYEAAGKVLAEKLKDASVVPVYSSRKNLGLALNWKVKFNETAKMPSYLQLFPELNHNEMAAEFGSGFHFILLKDEADHPKILKRMGILRELYVEKNWPVETVDLKGEPLLKIFSSLVLADWVTYYLALARQIDPLGNPMVEKFKKLLA